MTRRGRLLHELGSRARAASMAIALIAGVGVVVGMPLAAKAASTPFVCQPGFYQVLSGQLNELNPVTGAYTPIGAANSTYNAMGYNVLDNYMYALSTAAANKGDLLRIASDGSLTDLGLPTGLPAGSYVNADMDATGHLIVETAATTYYSINVSTNVATKFTVTGTTASANDMVWIAGKMYAMSGSNLYVLDLSTNVETAHAVTGISGTNFGAGFSDNPNELFFMDNATGTLYKLSGFTGTTPSATAVATGTASSNNDGAACKNADSPFNLPTANNDTYNATGGQTLSVSASGVLSNDVGSVLSATLKTNTSHGILSLNSDGSFTYTPTVPYVGLDSFTYAVTDQYGRTSATAATVTLNIAVPPTPAPANDSYTTSTGTTLSETAANGVLANDGGTGLTVTSNTQPASGSVSMTANGSFTYTPLAGYSGVQTFSYSVIDAYGQTASATVTLATTPTAVGDTYSATGGQTLTVPAGTGVLANDVGSGLTASLVASTSHGSLTLNPNGSLSYHPNNGYVGSDSFTYQAVDGDGLTSNTVTVTVTVGAPGGPVAVNDSFDTAAGTPLTVAGGAGLLSNDTGVADTVVSNTQPTNGSVSVAPNGSFVYTPVSNYSGTQTFTYTVSDAYGQHSTATVTLTTTPTAANDGYAVTGPQTLSVGAGSGVLANDDGSSLAASLVNGPSNGGLTLNSDGSFDYTPNTGFVGNDSFTYVATDVAGQATGTATATITVSAPAAPTAVDDTYVRDAGASFTVTAPTGVLANDNGVGLSASDLTQPTNGLVTLQADGSLDYTPAAGFSGTDTFDYQVTDAYGQHATAIVYIDITPVASPDSYSVTAGSTLTVTSTSGVLANDVGTNLTATLDVTTTHGQLMLNSDGSITYAPNAGFSGTDTFTYTATDASTQSTGPITVTISVGMPTAPVAVNAHFAVAHNTALTIAAASGLLVPDTGMDISVTNYTQPIQGVVSVDADGALTYTPPTDYSGTLTFSYTITDAYAQTASATVTLDVAPAPAVVPPPVVDPPKVTPPVADPPVAAPTTSAGVMGESAGTTLPHTGADVSSAAVAGAGFALMGLALLGGTRRRRRRT